MKKTIKTSLIILLAVLSMSAFIFSVAIKPSAVKAQANKTYITESLVMETPTAHIYNDTITGIKFTCEVARLKSGATYGIAVLPLDYFSKMGITPYDDVDFMYLFEGAFEQDIISIDSTVYECVPSDVDQDGKLEFSIGINNVRENNYDRQFVAIGYEKTVLLAQTSTTPAVYSYKYAGVKQENVKHLVELAGENLVTNSSLTEQQKLNLQGIVAQGLVNNGKVGFELGIDGKSLGSVGESIRLTSNLPESLKLKIKWSSSDESVALVDDNGQVSLKSAGQATITASVAGGLYTANKDITVNDTVIANTVVASVTSANDLNDFNVVNHSDLQFVGSSDLSQYGLSSEYTGNALKINGKNAGGSIPVGIVPRLSLEDFNDMVYAGYNDISVYVYAYADNDKAVKITKDDNSVYQGSAITFQAGSWTKLTFEINKSFTNTTGTYTVKQAIYSDVFLFRVYQSAEDRGQDSAMHILVSDVVFEESTKAPALKTNEIISVDNEFALKRIQERNDNKPKEFVSAQELESVYEITGDYTGNAVKIDMGPTGQISIIPRITKSEFDSLMNDGVEKLSFWVAAYADNGKDVRIRQDNSVYTAVSTTVVNKTWQKFEIRLDEAVSDMLYNQQAPFIGTYMSAGQDRLNSDGTQTIAHIFIGDVMFERTEDEEILFISGKEDTGAVEPSGKLVSKTYLSKQEWQAEQITGEYTGNAIKVTVTSGPHIKFYTQLTQTQYDKYFADGYTKLYFWVACYGGQGYNALIATGGVNAIKEDNLTNIAQKQWVKLTVQLSETVKSKLLTGESIQLFKCYNSSSDVTNGESTWFIGDIGFEK